VFLEKTKPAKLTSLSKHDDLSACPAARESEERPRADAAAGLAGKISARRRISGARINREFFRA
jgi:hypothetical protein